MGFMAPERHNYEVKVEQLIASGKIPKEAGLNHVVIRHDDWCGVHHLQRCNCDPDIEYLGDRWPAGEN